MNKTAAVQLHLIENGKITSWEAIQKYGATRLSSIIFNLRKRGMNIETEMIGHYAIYTYKKDEEK